MKHLKNNLTGAALGAGSALSGLGLAAGCAGGCTACFGCIGPGGLIIAAALFTRLTQKKRGETPWNG
jgi:hypothetical protein